MTCEYLCFVSLLRGALNWSVICECGISAHLLMLQSHINKLMIQQIRFYVSFFFLFPLDKISENYDMSMPTPCNYYCTIVEVQCTCRLLL